MPQYFIANGYVPRTLDDRQGTQQLIQLKQWLTQSVNSGMFSRRSVMAPSPWNWRQRIQPRQTVITSGTFDSRVIIRDVEQKLFNLMQIPISTGGSSKGYVTCKNVRQMREQPEVRGQQGGPFNPTQPERAENFIFWDVVRRLPDNDGEARQWGYVFHNQTQWGVIMRECRRYNLTLRDRLVRGYSAGRAHASAVRDMNRQSIELLYNAGFQLAIAVGSSGAMNFAPAIGDYAAHLYARQRGM